MHSTRSFTEIFSKVNETQLCQHSIFTFGLPFCIHIFIYQITKAIQVVLYWSLYLSELVPLHYTIDLFTFQQDCSLTVTMHVVVVYWLVSIFLLCHCETVCRSDSIPPFFFIQFSTAVRTNSYVFNLILGKYTIERKLQFKTSVISVSSPQLNLYEN